MTHPMPFSRSPDPMGTLTALPLLLLLLALLPPRLLFPPAHAQLVLSGNETKIDLVSGGPRRIQATTPDSLTILDFSRFPPSVTHLTNIPNTVVGPPSNIGITPDHSLALIANSLRMDPANPTNWFPESHVHVLDLLELPPRIIGRIPTGAQPSGLSITSDGRTALVANRAAGTISVLAIDGRQIRPFAEVPVCAPADSLSDVAIAPNGRTVLASVQKGGYLAVLSLAERTLTLTGQKVSTCGQPYRVVITPDGTLGLTAGAGAGNRLDNDALTVVDLTSTPIRTLDYIPLGAVPESIEVSPDGRLVAAVLMNGTNLAPGHPDRRESGELVLLSRRGMTYRVTSRHTLGRIPEGVAFTSDGRHLIVQCHADRELMIFNVRGTRVKDTGLRIPVPGMPSSLRAAP